MPLGLTTAFIYTTRFLEFDYGPGYPLRNERLGLTYDLISACGLLALPSIRYVEPEPATDDELLVFLKPHYLKILKAADTGDAPPGAFRYGLGTPDNPILPGIFRCLCWIFRVSGLKLRVHGPRNSGYGTRNFRNGTTRAYAWEEVREEVGLLKRLVFLRHGI